MHETLAVAFATLSGGMLVGVMIALLTLLSHRRVTWTRPVASPPDASVNVDVDEPPVTDPLDARWTLPDGQVDCLYFQQLEMPAAPNLDTPSGIFSPNWKDAVA